MKHRFFFLLIFIFSASPAFAEKIILKTGEVVEGTILSQTDTEVLIDTFDLGPVTYLISEISDVQFDGPPVFEEVIQESEQEPTPRMVVEEDAEIFERPVFDESVRNEFQEALKEKEEADQLGLQGVKLIQDGQMNDGLAMIKEAIEINPANPVWHMHYGSILFGNGSEHIKNGRESVGMNVIQQAEDELNMAIEKFDAVRDTISISQSYFLLGEIYFHIYQDKAQAQKFYRSALSFYDHPRAQAALREY